MLNDHYNDWRETTLFLAGILFTIVLFGALFRPPEFTFHRKDKNYHHTMNDMRLPPSCMTSMEKLQRFIDEMDKQCALRQANNQVVSVSLSNNDRISTTVDDNDSISIANESDLFDSYSADDITEIQHENQPKIDIVTFREKIFNDMTFLNERWRTIIKKQSETGTNSRSFRMPNFRYLMSTKTRERGHIVNTSATALTSSSHHGRDRPNSLTNEQKSNVLLSPIVLEENVNKKEVNNKSGKCMTV